MSKEIEQFLESKGVSIHSLVDRGMSPRIGLVDLISEYKNQSQDNWVSVEREPKDYQTVIVFDKGRMSTIIAQYVNGLFKLRGGNLPKNITHWQPLPKPPNKTNN